MRALAFAILFPPLWAATLQVEMRDSEVWLIRDGQPKQLTRDGKAKFLGGLSPASDRLAYYEQCPGPEKCTPAIVILDLSGRRLRSVPAKLDESPCTAILSLAWTGPNRIAAECHIYPSLSRYIEIDLARGRNVRDLAGYDFTRSPDGKKVAHVGWIVHFAPPYAHSNYLQVENRTLYPLPEGQGPVEQEGLTEPPQVVRKDGLTYSGIHEFKPGLSWSPDSSHIGLIDCTFDWTVESASQESDGAESNRFCMLAIVALDGHVTLNPLPNGARPHLAWTNAHSLTVEIQGDRKTFDVP